MNRPPLLIFFCFSGIALGIYQIICNIRGDLINLILPLILIILFINLFRLKNWSRIIVLIPFSLIAVYAIVVNLMGIFGISTLGSESELLKMIKHKGSLYFLVYILFHIYIFGFVYYFFRTKTKNLFS